MPSGRTKFQAPPSQITLRALADMDLYLARPYNVVRKLVDEAFAGIGVAPRVVAEIESVGTLTAVIANGLGATVLPVSMAQKIISSCNAWHCQIVEPSIEAPWPCASPIISRCLSRRRR